jgi:hypothetical protein
MTHLLLLSSLLGIAGQVPPPLLAPFKNLSDPGLVADISDYVVDAQGNHFVSAVQTLPTQLFLTRDGGRSWRIAPVVPRTIGVSPSGAYAPTSVVVNPENSDVLYGCSWRGIFRSNDGGKLWYLLRDGNCQQLAIDRGQRNILLAIVSSTLIRSIDAGSSWQQTGLTGIASIAAQDPTAC